MQTSALLFTAPDHVSLGTLEPPVPEPDAVHRGEAASDRACPRLVVPGAYAPRTMSALPYHERFSLEGILLVSCDSHDATPTAALASLAHQQLTMREHWGAPHAVAEAPEIDPALRTRTNEQPSAVFAW